MMIWMTHLSMMSMHIPWYLRSDENIAYIKAETRRINELLKDWFSQIGSNLIDFQVEFGKVQR